MNVKSVTTTAVSPVVNGVTRVRAIHRAKKHYRNQLASEGVVLLAEDAKRAAEDKAAKEAAKVAAEALALQEQQKLQAEALAALRQQLVELGTDGTIDNERLAALEEKISVLKG